MSVYVEVELRCDGVPNDPFGCTNAIHASTGLRARDEARRTGWRVSAPGGKDYCADHRKAAVSDDAR